MFGLALRTLRFRTGSFLASFLAVFLGAVILMAFASMLDTGSAQGVPDQSKETLETMGTVVGGWGLLLVVFAVTSTLTLSVRQRGREMALLKSVGATPAQVGRMIVGETAVLALLAAALAVPLAALAGRALLELLVETDQVAPGVDYRFGSTALGMGLGITFAASTIAATLTARRAAGMRVTESLLAAATEDRRMGKKRIVPAAAFMALGTVLALVTATAMGDEGSDAMMTSGQSCIWFAIGLALLSPGLVRTVASAVAVPLARLGGVSGYLTAHNVRQRSHTMASALMPIILFTGIATGTLYMQSIENAEMAASGLAKTNEQRNIETLNFVVIGMILLFAAIMLVNTLVAATTHRRREFGQQRLVGATPGQVQRMVALESAVLAVTGVLFGSVASLFTVIPYSIARRDQVVPDATVWIYLGIVTVAAVLTLAASLGTTRRGLRVPAIEAATAV
ncbi:transmembrane transport protein [Wenjunlia vitaminophila]|uniref:Transmembrane transport protein n=1 Tax=Wenjunlia vitaminophila TaxID=76728 RepID=A0A0T6LQP1_WENVI|nr:FtsX-like permease family protein [Wenjunlia vitaminophila]KRV48427.1 transmembrane transport protein [Wenjunlia vitaminophila]